MYDPPGGIAAPCLVYVEPKKIWSSTRTGLIFCMRFCRIFSVSLKKMMLRHFVQLAAAIEWNAVRHGFNQQNPTQHNTTHKVCWLLCTQQPTNA